MGWRSAGETAAAGEGGFGAEGVGVGCGERGESGGVDGG